MNPRRRLMFKMRDRQRRAAKAAPPEPIASPVVESAPSAVEETAAEVTLASETEVEEAPLVEEPKTVKVSRTRTKKTKSKKL